MSDVVCLWSKVDQTTLTTWRDLALELKGIAKKGKIKYVASISIIVWSTVDRWFKPQSGKTKDYKIGICCFSTKYATLRSKNKDWFTMNQNNVSE